MSSPPVFSGVRVARSLNVCVVFCRSLFVLLYFFFWPLCCLSFFDLWILITPLFGIFKLVLTNGDNQFGQYQQTEQSPLVLTELTAPNTITYHHI